MTDEPPEPPVIDLDGARLRPLRATDAAALYAYLRNPLVTEFTSFPEITVPMVEAMTALVLADHALRHEAQCGR